MNERRDKKWNETKTNDSWSIFKIMGEFVEGYEKLAAIGPCISIFGSARTHPENKFYKLAEDISQAIVERGYGVITGGGPGIMEAANKGANRVKGKSVGLCINLPFEDTNNKYIDYKFRELKTNNPSENQIKNLLKKIENYTIYDLDNKKLIKIESIKSKLFDV